MTTMIYLFITFSAPFGIAVGFLDCLSIITLPDYFDDYLGFATGIRSASISLGAIMFGYLLPILIDSLGWKKTFFTCSSLGAVCVVYSMAYHPPLSRKQEKDVILAEDQEIVAAAEISRKARSSYGFLRNKEFVSILIGSLLFVSVVGIPSMFIVCNHKIFLCLVVHRGMIDIWEPSSFFPKIGSRCLPHAKEETFSIVW